MSKNLMQSTWTPAAKVRRAFKAGPKRQKDVFYDMETAIIHGYTTFLELRKAMAVAGIPNIPDVKAGLVLITPETAKENRVHVVEILRGIENIPNVAAKITKLEKAGPLLPLGVALWQRDRIAGSTDAWVQPWLVNPRAALASAKATQIFEDGKEGEGTF